MLKTKPHLLSLMESSSVIPSLGAACEHAPSELSTHSCELAGFPLNFLQAWMSSYCGAGSLCWQLSVSIKLLSVEVARNSFLPPGHFSCAHTSSDDKPTEARTTATTTNRALFLIKAWTSISNMCSCHGAAQPEPQAVQKQAAPWYLHIADGQLAE